MARRNRSPVERYHDRVAGLYDTIYDGDPYWDAVFHLTWRNILRHLPKDHAARCLDVGCGTGILSLAFLRLGGKEARAVDIDPLALEAARHNALLNRQDGLRADDASLDDVDQMFPLLAANLTAVDLCQLAPRLSALLSPGGRLLASGMLRSQKDQVAAAMAGQALILEKESASGEWASLVLRKEVPW
jgi:ribosomal protein L11 methyltransferase